MLELLAATTGGHAYRVSKSQPLEEIYAQIAQEMRMQYTMSYIPSKKEEPGYRKIELKSKVKGLRIQTRFGYYSKR